MKRNLPLIIISLISVALIAACGNNPFDKDNTHVNIDDLAPQFELNDLDGNVVAMEDLVGEKVYIKYWASWCSICLAGLEELNTLAKEDNDFKVISIVSPGYKGEMSTEKFKQWFDSLPADQLTVLLDEKGVWASEFGVLAYPTSYYIGSNGVLENTVVGHHSNEEIASHIKNIN